MCRPSQTPHLTDVSKLGHRLTPAYRWNWQTDGFVKLRAIARGPGHIILARCLPGLCLGGGGGGAFGRFGGGVGSGGGVGGGVCRSVGSSSANAPVGAKKTARRTETVPHRSLKQSYAAIPSKNDTGTSFKESADGSACGGAISVFLTCSSGGACGTAVFSFFLLRRLWRGAPIHSIPPPQGRRHGQEGGEGGAR
eukprot:gene818-biopygen16700